jgi:hypothetical protein
MAENYKKKLPNLLGKLFQFDFADLDFGIYRIMNKKRDEIEQFIEEDLIGAVDALDDSGGLNQIYVTTPFAKKLAG